MAQLAILAVLALASAATGREGDGETGPHATGAKSSNEAAREDARAKVSRRGKTIKVVRSRYGPVIADRRGEALYLFDRDRGKRTRCYGACAQAWPPVLTRGRPRAGRGVKARLLGTTRRGNGRLQVTYRNHPLYYYVADAPGRILCQNVDEFGGLWLVVKPSGRPVKGAG
jgi:predicted lipoprotein with Yx(FWY)xxD motif